MAHACICQPKVLPQGVLLQLAVCMPDRCKAVKERKKRKKRKKPYVKRSILIITWCVLGKTISKIINFM